jgi:hypothetical protein
MVEAGEGKAKKTEIYLFDTRLGLPMPNPKGEPRPATLTEIRRQAGACLDRLKVDPKLAYDVTPAQAATAVPLLVCELPALAPRMRMLERYGESLDALRFADDPGRLRKKLATASEAAGVAAQPIAVWREALRSLRNSLQRGEGGSEENAARMREFTQSLVPPLEFLPPSLQTIMIQLPDGVVLKKMLQNNYATPFLAFYLSEGQPRDLILRGKLRDAAQKLVANLTLYRQQQEIAKSNPELEKNILKWWQEVLLPTYASMSRAESRGQRDPSARAALPALQQKLGDSIRKQEPELATALNGGLAVPLAGNSLYLLALCKHEQAVDLRTKAERGSVKPDAVQSAWQDAVYWWEKFASENPAALATPTARVFQALALAELNDRATAAKLLENIPAELPLHDKIARLYLARQLRDQKEKAGGGSTN